MRQDIYDLVERNPVIAAVKDEAGLAACCAQPEVRMVFLLYGDLITLPLLVDRLKQADKLVLVHIDLVAGLSAKEISVDFIKSATRADGIISTRPALLRRARELSLCTVLRVFLLDSMALHNIERQISTAKPDMLELLPGLMSKIIRRVTREVRLPVIAGGLIADKEDVMQALSAGALAVSTTKQLLWQS